MLWEREMYVVACGREKKVKGIGWGGWVSGVYFLLNKKIKKLNGSLLNYNHVSRERNFRKILRISSISYIKHHNQTHFFFSTKQTPKNLALDEACTCSGVVVVNQWLMA